MNIIASQELTTNNINNIFSKYSKISLALTYFGFLILLIFHMYIKSPTKEIDSDFQLYINNCNILGPS